MKGKLTVLMITAFVDMLVMATLPLTASMEDYAATRTPSVTKIG